MTCDGRCSNSLRFQQTAPMKSSFEMAVTHLGAMQVGDLYLVALLHAHGLALAARYANRVCRWRGLSRGHCHGLRDLALGYWNPTMQNGSGQVL